MEAFPHMATIKSFIEHEADAHPQSHVMDFHNKADGHERRLATYLVENLRMATDLEVRSSSNAMGLILADIDNLDLYILDTGGAGGGNDVWIPRLAAAMGRREALRRCPAMANQ